VTVKHYKFAKLPEVLSAYTHVVHIDASYFASNFNSYQLPSYKFVRDVIAAHPEVELFATAHRARKQVDSEWRSTIRWELENATALQLFKDWLNTKGAIQPNGLPVEDVFMLEMGLFIRKVGAVDMDEVFNTILETMMRFGLQRDQNLFTIMLSLHTNVSRRVAVVFRCSSDAFFSVRGCGYKCHGLPLACLRSKRDDGLSRNLIDTRARAVSSAGQVV